MSGASGLIKVDRELVSRLMNSKGRVHGLACGIYDNTPAALRG